MVDYVRKVLRGSALIFLMSAIASVLTYVFRIYLARELTVEEYGLIFAVLSLILFVNVFRVLGISDASVKYIVDYIAKKDYSGVKTVILSQVIIISFTTTFFVILLWLSSSFLSLNYFSTPLARPILLFFIFYFVIHAFNVIPLLLLRGFQNEKAYSLAEPIRIVGLFISTVVLLYFGLGILSPVIGYAIGSFVSFLVMFFLSRKYWFVFSFRKYSLILMIKKLFLFGIPLMFGGFGNLIINQLDVLLITLFMTLTDVGVYNVVLPTAMMFLIFGTSVSTILFPMFSELYSKKSFIKIKEGISLIYKYLFVFFIPFFLAFFAFADVFLVTAFGETYFSGVLPFRLLLIGVLFFMFVVLNNTILNATGNPNFVMKSFLFVALFNAVFNILLIPHFGLLGAAFTTMLSYFLLLLFSLYKLHKLFNISAPWFQWLKTFFVGIIFLLSIYFLKNIFFLPLLFEICLVIFLSGLIYLILSMLMGLINIKEIKIFIKKFL